MYPMLCEDEMWFRLTAEFLNGVDPLQLSRSLYQNGIVTETVYKQIFEMTLDNVERREVCKALLDNLTGVHSIHLIIEILRKCGYHRLARKVYCLADSNKSSLVSIRKTSSQPSKKVHTFFKDVKRLVHNAAFKNPRKALRQMAGYFRNKLSLVESNSKEQQRIADKYVALLGAEIDAIAISFDHRLPDNEIFIELKNLIGHSTNTLITDIIYYGRLANANAIGNNFENGKLMLLAARQTSEVLDQCLERVNVYYIEVYVRLWEFESNPTTELRDQLIEMGYLGLKCLKQEDEDIQVLWTRMFILRMVFCLLGIGNRANIIKKYCPSKDDIEHAKSLLAKLDQYWHEIETRREMFYSVAKARLTELEGDAALAYIYTKKALELAKMGKFKELTFIKEYLTTIEQKVKANLWRQDVPIAAGVKISTSEDEDHKHQEQRGTLQVTFPTLQSFTTASSFSPVYHRSAISTHTRPYVDDETELKNVIDVHSEKCIYSEEDEKNSDMHWDFPRLQSNFRSSISTDSRSNVEFDSETNEKLQRQTLQNSSSQIFNRGEEKKTKMLQWSFPSWQSDFKCSSSADSKSTSFDSETFENLPKQKLSDVSFKIYPNFDAYYDEAMPQIHHQFPELYSDTPSSLPLGLDNVSTADSETDLNRLQSTEGNHNTQDINDMSATGGVKFIDDPRYSNTETEDYQLSPFGSAVFSCSFENKHSQSDIVEHNDENQK